MSSDGEEWEARRRSAAGPVAAGAHAGRRRGAAGTHRLRGQAGDRRAGPAGRADARRPARPGHLLLEGVPGVAKTLAVETFARVVGGTFARLQFTPDLVPVRHPRHPDLPAGPRGVRRRARPGGGQLRARRRDQPRPGEGAVGAAGGDGRAARVDRRADLPDARPVPRARHPEPDRERGRLPAARGAARPLPLQDHRRATRAPEEEREIVYRMGAEPPVAQQVLRAGGARPAAERRVARVRAPRARRLRRAAGRRHPHARRARAGRRRGLGRLRRVAARHAGHRRAPPGRWRWSAAATTCCPRTCSTSPPDVLRHRLVLSYDAVADRVPVDRILGRVLAGRPAAAGHRPYTPPGCRADRPAAAAAPVADLARATAARAVRLRDPAGWTAGAGHGAGADGPAPARRAAAGQPPRPGARARAPSRGRPGSTSPATTCAGWTGRSPPAPPSRTCGRRSPTGSWRPGWSMDLSASLDFGTGGCEKRDLAVAALAAVAHLTPGRRQPDRRDRRARASRRCGSRPAAACAHARGLLRAGRAHAARTGGTRGDLAARRRGAAPPAAAARAGRRDLRLPRRARVGARRCGRCRRATSCSRSRCSTRASWSCPTSARSCSPTRRPAASARCQTTPLLCREFAAAAAAHRDRVAVALRRCGAAHLRLRTDSRLDRRHRPVRRSPASAAWIGRRHGTPDGVAASGRGRGELRHALVAAAARRRRRAGRRLPPAAAPPPPRHAARSPTWSCWTGSRRTARAGCGTSPPLALLVALALLTVALAGPTAEARVPRNRATVVLVIDVSLSMQATDVEPTRLAAAQAAAKAFADQLTPGVNLGLVSFAGTAAVLVSPTTDRASVKRAVDGLQLAESTATGEAISRGAAVDRDVLQVRLGGRQDGPAARADRADDRRQADRAGARRRERAARGVHRGRKAAEAKVPVSTISFGTDYGSIEIDDEPHVGGRGRRGDAADRRAVGRAVLHRGQRRRSCAGLRRAGRADRLRDASRWTRAARG